jgi:hypothetical protein
MGRRWRAGVGGHKREVVGRVRAPTLEGRVGPWSRVPEPGSLSPAQVVGLSPSLRARVAGGEAAGPSAAGDGSGLSSPRSTTSQEPLLGKVRAWKRKGKERKGKERKGKKGKERCGRARREGPAHPPATAAGHARGVSNGPVVRRRVRGVRGAKERKKG